MSGGSHRDLSSHSTSEEEEDSKSEKVSHYITPVIYLEKTHKLVCEYDSRLFLVRIVVH